MISINNVFCIVTYISCNERETITVYAEAQDEFSLFKRELLLTIKPYHPSAFLCL